MKRLLSFFATALFAICILLNGTTSAQTFDMKSREWSSKRTGSAIKSCFQTPAAGCDTIVSQVDFYTQPSQVGQLYNVKDLRAFVKFSVNHADNQVDSAYTYQLVYQLRGFKSLNFSGTPDVLTDTLLINYNPDSVNAYQDVHLRSYYGYYRIEVKVLDIYDYTANYAAALAGSASVPPPNNLLTSGSSSAALNEIAKNWIIEAGMVLQTFDLNLSGAKEVYSPTMTNITLAPTSALLPGTNMLRVDWKLSASQTPVPAMYELEWTFVDDYSASITDATLHIGTKTAGELTYDFQANSSRVITNKTSYDIPLVYKRGHLLYRVRMLRPDAVNYLQTKYSPWSNPATTGLVSATQDRYQITNAHLGDNANWNYEASFAEDGKSKQVLGYFDGLLKSRQTLTRFSSRQNELIGAETFYDYEGRAALQTLPVPVMQVPNLSYIPSFALSATKQQPYTAADIDALVSPGAVFPALPALHMGSAAAKYYSPQNPLLNTTGDTIMKAVPDAEGYPMMQTLFSADDPKRVRRQGSAGKTLQLGKGHETSYYYSDPEQDELNRYFGVNIGMSPFYEKVITRDPNQELSFSVLNNAGKPVMTGLMGFPDSANATTLLNLDSVSIPAPANSQTLSNLLNGVRPVWSGNQRVFSKTLFREALGGALNLSVEVPQFYPCRAQPVSINIPFRVDLSVQGEFDALPTPVVTAGTAVPINGTSSGPSIGTIGAAVFKADNLSFGAASTGETKLRYALSYNPDDLDAAVRAYTSNLPLFSGCFYDPNFFRDREVEALPVDCNDEANEDALTKPSGSSPCARYESLMKDQLMPLHAYAEYIVSDTRDGVIVGNGRSLFAIVGWEPLSPSSGYPAVTQEPSPWQAADFAPTCWPAFISSSLPAMGLATNVKIDLATQYYRPVYAYQYYLKAASLPSTVTTVINGWSTTLDLITISVKSLIEQFNDDVVNVLMPLHPEYCQYLTRYCDGSDYSGSLQAIPSVTAAQQVGRYQLSDIVDSDPFAAVYAAQPGKTKPELGYMIYKLTDGSGTITGEREVAIDYFAYLMTICDGGANPTGCWGASLPNAPGGKVTAPAGMLNGLSSAQLELYYANLVSQYIANRGRKIALYRKAGYTCPPSLSLTEPGKIIFEDYTDSSGNPLYAAGPPSYSDLTSGSLQTKIGAALSNSKDPGSATNTQDDYARVIVQNLLNCRTGANQNYDQALFASLYNDLRTTIAGNIQSGRDRIWKGGITPAVLSTMLASHSIAADDICNPFLVNYQLSERSAAEQCKPAGNYCSLIGEMQLNNSVLQRSVVDIAGYIKVNPGPLPTAGSGSVTPNYTNLFNRTLAGSLGFQYPFPATIGYNWSISTDSLFTLQFSNGSRSVSVRIPFSYSWLNYYQDPNGTILGIFNPADTALINGIYRNYATNNGEFVFQGCYDEPSDRDTLRVKAVYIRRYYTQSSVPDPEGFLPPAGLLALVNAKIIGLDVSQLLPDTSDYSRACMHTCIACNELKDAYRVYQAKVAAPYGIKGKGHPFYERSLRSFMNYYFRNRHFTDEYLDFMKGCSLTDSLFLPQYYGYFQAHAPSAGGAIGMLLNAIRSLAPVSPAGAPFAGANAGLPASAENLKYLQYVDAQGEEYLYVDFSNLYSDERLRPYIVAVTNYLNTTPGMGGVSWNFNKLNAELPGRDPYTVDIFLPGVNKAFSTAASGLSLTSENVIVKDAASSTAPAQLSTPFTHYRFSAGAGTSAPALAGMWSQLASDLKDALQAGAGITGYLELNSNESYRTSHRNTAADKLAYLGYVYNLNTDHEATLNQLRAPAVQANVYTPGSQPVRDVAYMHGISGSNAAPSATLELNPYNSVSLNAPAFQFLKDILDSCKYSRSNITFPTYPLYTPDYKLPAVVAAGTPFAFAIPGGKLKPGTIMPETLLYDSRRFQVASVIRIANNSYSFAVRPLSYGPNPRSYHIQIRLPEYIDRREALRYGLVSVQPMVYGNSRRYFSARFELPGNPAVSFMAVGKTDFDIVSSAPDIYENIMLCDDPGNNSDSIDICYDHLYAQALQNADAKFAEQQNTAFSSIRKAYLEYLNNEVMDTLKVSLPQLKYAVTLYNYDRAGNLTATTPPAGVQPMSNTSDVDKHRAGSTVFPVPVPAHQKQSLYTYSAQNQKLTETTPDGGLTRFFYDVAGRLVLSQSSRQAPKDQFSYTLYDDQNRPVETGQIVVPAGVIYSYSPHKLGGYISDCIGQFYGRNVSHQEFRAWVTDCIREEVTRTTYDTAMYVFATTNGATMNNGMSRQDNLRSRVAAVASYPVLAAGFRGYEGYSIALHYSYDLSGNLKTLTYDMPSLSAYRQRYKRIDYDYDLYSGKVTLVSYNRGFADQFYQRYSYDDDNRITRTETSRDGILWDRDAAYQYYPHGPLARISLGDQRVQGVDFAYTLQGWLKTINGDSPDDPADIGGDGTGNNAHQRDLFRTTLSYFDGDYKPLNPTDATYAGGSKLLKLPAPPTINRSLYNGNIAAMATLPGYFAPLYSAYRYDKLNRLKSADYTVPDYSSSTPLAAGALDRFNMAGPVSRFYHSDYSYDLDGNLSALNRYGVSGSPAMAYNKLDNAHVYLMDSLRYQYFSGNRTNNRLTNFTDAADHSAQSWGFSNDLARYNPANADSLLRMQYDASGNLVQDLSNGLTAIKWNFYGKSREVIKDDGHVLRFAYDPLGNRFSKTTITSVPGRDSVLNTEYYIREASGNILATYRQQQHYNYYDIYERLAGNAGLRNYLAPGFTADGSFGGMIAAGTDRRLSGPFTATKMYSTGTVAGYLSRSPTAVASLMDATPSFSARLLRYSPALSDRLYPPGPGASWEPFLPLAAGITDSAELDRSAALLFAGADSLAMRDRYRRYHTLDSGAAYSPAFMGTLLADDIRDWRSQGGDVALEQLRALVTDTSGAIYSAAVRNLVADSNYVRNPLGSDTAQTLDGRLRRALAAIGVAGQDDYVPGGNDPASAALIRNFLGQQSGSESSETTINRLRQDLSQQTLLNVVYDQNPQAFVASLLGDGSYGGGTPAARQVVADALRVASGGSPATETAGSLGELGSPMRLIETMSTLDPGAGAVLTPMVQQLLDYDRFYLAEHHLYGASRLGIKKYWPYQYRYEWRKEKTVAQNVAGLDSSEVSYRYPWYYGPWQSLVGATYVDPAGHANTANRYVTRTLGQKGYELTNHLGNVMAVVSDKVSEQPAAPNGVLPSLAVKRAGLSAAYDYYPFGMQMPARVVEDATVQCIPVSRTRRVDKIFRSADLVRGWYLATGIGQVQLPTIEATTANTAITYRNIAGRFSTPVYNVDVKGNSGANLALDAQLTLDAMPAGSSGVIVDYAITESNHPTITGTNRSLIGPGTLRMELRNLSRPGTGGQSLVIGTRMGPGTGQLQAPPGTVLPGDQLRVVMHYDGPPLYWYVGPTGAQQAQFTLTTLVINTLKPVDQQYVALSCDTDGAYTAGYRFGFNGQMRDNEVAGLGNHLDFGERGYDPRRVGWWTSDKLAAKYPGVSPYAFCRDNPILRYDPDGNTDYTASVKTSKSSNGAILKTVTVNIVYDILNVSSKDVFNANQVAGAGYNDETFSGSFDSKDVKGRDVTVNVVANISYRMITNVNQVRDNENVMFIVDDIGKSRGEGVSNPVGMADHGGNVMAAEYAYLSDAGLMRHEQGHNLGFNFAGSNPSDPTHSISGYMNAHSATGKNERVGRTAPGILKQAFGHFVNMGEVTNLGQGSHNAKAKAQNFFDRVNLSYDEKKAKAAGLK